MDIKHSFLYWLKSIGQCRSEDGRAVSNSYFNRGLRKFLLVLVVVSALGIMTILLPDLKWTGKSQVVIAEEPSFSLTSDLDINEDSKNQTTFHGTSDPSKLTVSTVDDLPVKEVSFPVYICGAVLHPGVVQAAPGNYISMLVDQCGGFSEEADLRRINLAMEVQPYSMVYIPLVGETDLPDVSFLNQFSTSDQGDHSGLETSYKQEDGTQKINLNKATLSELCTLPGIGEATGLSIISYREEQGCFQNIEDIMEVPGIKQGKFDRIKDNIKVD